MNYLILTLHNPNKDILKNYQTEIYQYLSNGKIN